MKRVLKILAGVIGLILLVVLLGAAYVNWAPLPTYEVKAPALTVTPDSSMIARGEHLTALTCAICHRGKNTVQLEGEPWREKDFGDLYTANLTRHPESTLSAYSDGELAFLLRTGLKRNGEVALIMPRYTQLSDQDLRSVIAYLRSDAPSTQPSDKQWPERKVNFLAKMLTRVAIKPYDYPSAPVGDPDLSDPVAHGRYLAHNLACFVCHSAGFETVNELNPEQSPGYFGGGTGVQRKESTDKVLSSNLTPHPEYGLGRYTAQQFGQAVRYGKRFDGTSLDHAMPLFTNLTDPEVNAIWAYLQTVPVIDHQVERLAFE